MRAFPPMRLREFYLPITDWRAARGMHTCSASPGHGCGPIIAPPAPLHSIQYWAPNAAKTGRANDEIKASVRDEARMEC